MIICRWPKAKAYYPPLPLKIKKKKKERKKERRVKRTRQYYQLLN
jgi:hypothetical protein